jgi:ABC-type branched-subunit amino acid transport system permease subunit
LRATLGGMAPGLSVAVLGAVLILAALFLKQGLVGALKQVARRAGWRR